MGPTVPSSALQDNKPWTDNVSVI